MKAGRPKKLLTKNFVLAYKIPLFHFGTLVSDKKSDCENLTEISFPVVFEGLKGDVSWIKNAGRRMQAMAGFLWARLLHSPYWPPSSCQFTQPRHISAVIRVSAVLEVRSLLTQRAKVSI